MCGITGILAPDASGSELMESILLDMTRTMCHRGPDDEGIYINPTHRLGLGFRRLSIIDLSPAGHQPMSNEDGSMWIVFNGEIYNHGDLRPELESRGHLFRSRTDTESIIHLYEEHGEDCVQFLRGMFAFAIWDENKQQLFLARDRIGIKPLYYCHSRGRFLFASEIKAILQAPNVARSLCREAFFHYLTFMVPPAPMTMFEGVQKLEAGHTLSIDKHGHVSKKRYWDAIVPSPVDSYPDEYYMERVMELLRESVRLRMMSDVPYGVFLSGGVDSSTNVALMSQLSSQPVNTFSVGFEKYEQYNELQYARQIAQRFNTRHHEIVINHQDALDYLPQLVWSQDEPIADWVCVPLHFVSKLVRDSGVIVAQVGEGADELFSGYPAYLASLRQQCWWSRVRWIPNFVWKTGNAATALLHDLHCVSPRTRDIAYRLAHEGREMFWGGAIVFRSIDKRRLVDTPYLRNAMGNGKPLASMDIPTAVYRHFDERKPAADLLERMIYLELKQRLPELLLMRVDKITMGNSIEARVPFLDHKLVEFAMSIPMEVKLRNGEPKSLLKRAVADLLPRDIIYRRKQGFTAPVAEWLRHELAGEIESALLNGQLVRHELINREEVSRLFAEHQSQRRNRAVYLWNLYNLEMWYRHWIA
jgi:asparagine synthase (glutamine-hydrolysing)